MLQIGLVQCLDQGLIGQRRRKLATVAPDHGYPSPLGIAGYLLHQPALAHPRASAQKDQPSAPRDGQVQMADQICPLRLASHQGHLVGSLQQGQRSGLGGSRQVRDLPGIHQGRDLGSQGRGLG